MDNFSNDAKAKTGLPTLEAGVAPSMSLVKITAADFNGRDWDECPFDSVPDWLRIAVSKGDVTAHTRNHTDYAEFDVRTADGVVSAGPGDRIGCRADGLFVVKADRQFSGRHSSSEAR